MGIFGYSTKEDYADLERKKLQFYDKLISKIESQQNQINNLNNRLEGMTNAMESAANVLESMLQTLQVNQKNVEQINKEVETLKKYFPEHKPRENFKDMFNT